MLQNENDSRKRISDEKNIDAIQPNQTKKIINSLFLETSESSARMKVDPNEDLCKNPLVENMLRYILQMKEKKSKLKKNKRNT